LGVVTRVQTARAELPVTAAFADGTSHLGPQMQLYGTTGGKEWALLSSLPPGMELEGFARQAADETAAAAVPAAAARPARAPARAAASSLWSSTAMSD
jgi:hypothetical protein